MVECDFLSLVVFPVLPRALDISSFTSPLINHTVGYITESVERKEFAALLREADEIEKLKHKSKRKKMKSPAIENL